MKKLLLGILLVIFVSTAFGLGDDLDLEKEKANMLETDRAFSRMSVKQGTIEAFHHFMAEDGLRLPRKGRPVGREFFKNLLVQQQEKGQEQTRRTVLKWDPILADISKCCDLGYTYGRYEVTQTNQDGKKNITYGYYVSIWKKQADGNWRFVFDAGNEDPDPKKKKKK